MADSPKREPAIKGVLVAETGADGNPLAAGRAATAEHGGSALGLHAGPKAVGLDALAAVGLKCALGHGNALLLLLVEIYAWTASLEYTADSLWNLVQRPNQSRNSSQKFCSILLFSISSAGCRIRIRTQSCFGGSK